jgi:tRNA threonylcarbamoyladenosine biosynthesis protein TsaB
MKPTLISLAIETSCRRGQACLGLDDQVAETTTFPAGQRHAVQLVPRTDELLRRRGYGPADVREVYASAGPGGFTGLRVGITVARTLCQAVGGARCVAVPTIQALAAGAAGADFVHLGVLMAAKDQTALLGLFQRRGDEMIQVSPPGLVEIERLAELLPKPVLLIGEALEHCRPAGDGISIGDESLWLPQVIEVWRIGRKLAAQGQYTPPEQVLPIYAREPEAVRLWEKRGQPAK